jgi:AraC-like DNA-binding protein
MPGKRGDIVYTDLEFFPIPDDFLNSFSKNPLAGYVTVTHTGHYVEARHHHIKRDDCPTAYIMYCYAGTGWFRLNGGGARELNPGQVMILPPWVPHEYASAGKNPWSHYWIHLTGCYFDYLYENKSLKTVTEISDTAGLELVKLFHQCFDILRFPYRNEEFLHVCQLGASMLSLITYAGKRSSRHLLSGGSKAIERTVAFMKKRLNGFVTLEELSDAAGYSVSHLNFLFKSFSRYAPVQYFLRMKIQSAARDLLISDRSIAAIAENYGFGDPYYFSRLFRKIMGFSPRQYCRLNGKYDSLSVHTPPSKPAGRGFPRRGKDGQEHPPDEEG